MPTQPLRSSGWTRTTRRRLIGITAVWVVAAVVVLLFAVVTSIGPVLLSLYGEHGVHLGDLVVLLFAGALAAGATVWLRRRA